MCYILCYVIALCRMLYPHVVFYYVIALCRMLYPHVVFYYVIALCRMLYPHISLCRISTVILSKIEGQPQTNCNKNAFNCF